MVSKKYRLERDYLGKIRVPKDAYWGAETQRAIENFPVSGFCFPREFLRALGMVKLAAAEVNMKLGLLPRKMGKAIRDAAWEVMEGKLDHQFPVDVFQTGSGTSTHMNANEVIAHRANAILGARNLKEEVHPNDHVNRGQSSNDVIPSCLHIAAAERIQTHLLPALEELQLALEGKAKEFQPILKIGRTHLQDATPIRLGQEFGGYAAMIGHGKKRVRNVLPHLMELALGGTAVGTGINTHPRFAFLVIQRIHELTGMSFREAENHFEAQGAKDAVVETSSALKTLAVSLMKIANDLRWLSSGPRCGIGEIVLPELQPGSSIMPGKVNPVIPEALTQVCAQVMGHDATIAIAAMSGNFELNVMMPVITHNLLQSIALLSRGVHLFTRKCIQGIRANKERCLELVEKSLSLVTALTPRIGYNAAAEIAREAYASGKTIREVALARRILLPQELSDLLDPWKMTGTGIKSKIQKTKTKTRKVK
jgi:fumarate hydratase class II